MSLLGKAALAMWWDIAPQFLPDFEHWHAHEHFPERLGIPGFRRASRFTSADGGEGIFVMYELDDYGVLSSPGYLARLNAPSPWSVRMMPLHRNMVRSQCRVLESAGGLAARHALTVRLSPADGRADELRGAVQALACRVVMQPGITGLHLLRHDTPKIDATEEQRIRGLSDRVADWVLVASGYDAACLKDLASSELGDVALAAMGAALGAQRGFYSLAYSAVAGDMQ